MAARLARYGITAGICAAVAGGLFGRAAVAVFDVVINGRYALANRVEAKRRRRAQRDRPSPPS
jgi:hypothetical protein